LSILEGISWVQAAKAKPLILPFLLGGAYSSGSSGERILARTGSEWVDLTSLFIGDPLILLEYPVRPFYGKYAKYFIVTYGGQAKAYDGSEFTDLTQRLGFGAGGEIMCAANGPDFWLIGGWSANTGKARLVKLSNDLNTVTDVTNYCPWKNTTGIYGCEYAPELGVFLIGRELSLYKTQDGVSYVNTNWNGYGPFTYSVEWNGSYFLVGSLGSSKLWKYDGSSWTEVTGHPFTEVDEDVRVVRWNGEYFLIGSSFGRLVKYDGTSFTTLKTYTLAVTGVAWFVRDGSWYIGGSSSDGAFNFLEAYDGSAFVDVKPTSGFTRGIGGLDAQELLPPSGKVYLLINAKTGGTTSPLPGIYLHDKGSQATVIAIPDSGYEFSYWTINGELSMDNPVTKTLNATTTMNAYFVASLYFENWSSIDSDTWEYYAEHVLDTGDYVSPPSSLTNTPDMEIALLCKRSNTINLPEGKTTTHMKIDTNESTYRSTASFFVKCNAPVGQFFYATASISQSYPYDYVTYCYDGYTVAIRPISGKVWIIYTDDMGTPYIKDEKTITSPPSNWLSWNKYRVSWWSEGNALKVRVERLAESGWVKMCDDLTDPSRVDAQTQRFGIGGYISIDDGVLKFDDTSVFG
jgi:hypothetical protein